MSGVRTYVTVEPLEKGHFGCTLNLVEFFDADEVPVKAHDFDFVVHQKEKQAWEIVGKSKVTMMQDDLNNLGAAILENQ